MPPQPRPHVDRWRQSCGGRRLSSSLEAARGSVGRAARYPRALVEVATTRHNCDVGFLDVKDRRARITVTSTDNYPAAALLAKL